MSAWLLRRQASKTNPKPRVDTPVFGAVWLLGETVAIVDCLVVCRAAPDGRTPTRTSIGLPLARRLSKSDRLFPSVHKILAGILALNQNITARWGSCAGLEMSISVPNPKATETGEDRRKKQISTRRPVRKWKKQTGCPSTSEYARGIVQVPTDEVLSWKSGYVSTASRTHPGARQADTNTTTDLALVYPSLAPCTYTEILTSHRRDHLPLVLRLQKPGIDPRRILKFPIKYGKSDTGVMSKQ